MTFLIILICVVLPIVGIGTAVNNYFKEKDKPKEKEDLLPALEKVDNLKEISPNVVSSTHDDFVYEEPTVDQLIAIVMDYLAAEGFRPRLDDYSVWFKNEGLSIEVSFTENDPHYFCLISRFEYDKQDFENIVYLINEFLPQFKLGQAFVNDKTIGISADTLIYGMHNVIPAFKRVFGIHTHIVDSFGKELAQLSAKNLN